MLHSGLMLADVARAIELQDLDTRAAQLEKEIAALPKHIAQIERKLEAHQRKLEADQAALAANLKERKRLEGDVQVFQQKIAKLREQMMQAKTNEQYRAFQNEIGYCETEIQKTEDRILDLMAESEPLERNVKAAEESLKSERAEVEKEKAEARRRTEADKRALEEISAKRRELVAAIHPRLLQRYDSLRRTRGGVAVAEVVEGRCTACRIALRIQFFQDLKADKDVLCCESCGRILYFNPPVEAGGDSRNESASAPA